MLKKYTGKSLAVDMYNCDLETLSDKSKMETLLDTGCADYGMEKKHSCCYQEEGKKEYSLHAVCMQGHVIMHVYPEIGFITMDIYSCYDNSDTAGLARFLRLAVDADKTKTSVLDRGDFGSKNDMKPTHRSNIKFIRRTKNVTKNVSDKLKDLILKPRSI